MCTQKGQRLCIDYRQLKSRTVPGNHLPPRIQDTHESLERSHWFRVLN